MALSKLQLSELLATYRELLTDNQIGVLSMYCDCDCSLAEIATETGISRQGVRDAVVKGEKTLTKLEDALHLVRFKKEVYLALDEGDDEKIKYVVKNFVIKE